MSARVVVAASPVTAGPWTAGLSGCSPFYTVYGRLAVARRCAAWGDGDGGIGSEELVWDLAFEQATGQSICGCAMGWRISLQQLERVLVRAGISAWLSGPLLVAHGRSPNSR